MIPTRAVFAVSATVLLLMPQAAFSAGTSEPKRTRTTVECTEAQVYDEATRTCVDARESSLSDDARLDAARELATFGRAGDALRVLATLVRPDTADALTVRGYAMRKAGDFDAGVALYMAALEIDGENWLARSYLGQGLLERGDRAAAEVQLELIRAGGARGTWPEIALTDALGGKPAY